MTFESRDQNKILEHVCVGVASRRLPVPVVSVGNITWGGNGKTPMVETLSGWFLGAGICPLILTRVKDLRLCAHNLR